MPRPKYAHAPRTESEVVPFENAQEAWFWFIRCQKMRHKGAMKMEVGSITRPCEADDIYRAVRTLISERKILKEHLLVLGRFGFREQPPDIRCVDQKRAARVWSEALDRLSTILKTKEIVQ